MVASQILVAGHNGVVGSAISRCGRCSVRGGPSLLCVLAVGRRFQALSPRAPPGAPPVGVTGKGRGRPRPGIGQVADRFDRSFNTV
jgi:hypothetical protein